MQSNQVSVGATIRVLVVDDTRIHTQLLADALRRDRQLDVIAPSVRSRDLIETVKQQRINVVVLSSNIDAEPLRGFELLRQLRASNPGTSAIVLLDSSKRETVLQAFHAGARGIFSRHDSMDSLSKCIRSVYEGQVWANSEQVSFVVEALACSPVVRAVDANGLSLLSKREMDVVRSLAEGLTNREIAERLGLSQHTIKNYLFRVYDKLGVSNRLELLFMTLSQANGPQSNRQAERDISRNRRSSRAKASDAQQHSSNDGEMTEHNFPLVSSGNRLEPARATQNENRSEPRFETRNATISSDPLD
jgi:DNA-binding NarL/FixJ family response regulator